jgi:hypothetical protein
MPILINLWLRITVALIVSISTAQAESEGDHDLLIFLNAGPAYHQVSSEDGIEENDFIVGTDILYGFQKDDLRFLAEYILSNKESELERLQLGWQINEDNIGWLGRFHSPSRYWNSVYHHGQYMQTSITRPLVEKFEDEGGVLPTHVTGLMLENLHKLQGLDGFRTSFSVGTAALISNFELKPFDVLDASSKHKEAVDLRLAYLPDLFGENQFGLLFNWSDMAVEDNTIAQQDGLLHVKQGVIGAYVDWREQQWRILANLTYVDNQMIMQTGEQTDTFSAVYFQAEYEIDQKWIIFGRMEDTHDKGDSAYLKLFPYAVLQRNMLGLRYDFYRNNALTLELSKFKTQSDEIDQAWLQWSAVLP